MPDFILFDEGAAEVLDDGISDRNIEIALSTLQITSGGLEATDTHAGGFGEITGTGYARGTQVAPNPSGRSVTFEQESFATGAASDWPADVRSAVAILDLGGSKKLLAAWHLLAGGTSGRDLSEPNTTENVTPTLTI